MAGIGNLAYISTTSFSISGTDYTDECMFGRRLLCDCDTDGEKAVTINTSSWNSTITTVTLIADDSEDITSNILTFRFGPGVGSLGSVSARGLDHNKLSNINGGNSTYAYHLSASEYNDLTDGSDTTLHDHDGISENSAARHTQGTDTALGAQSENLDMNTHKIVGVVDPTTDQEAATKKYVDDKYYLHTQAATATSWTVTHNLSFLYPNIELISGGKSLSGTYDEPEITYNTTNQLTCTFTTETSGYCYCVGGS